MKLLVKKKDGKVHIRSKSQESGENIENVAPNKIKSWIAIAKASHDAAGGTMEDVIQSVIDEMRGTVFKSEKPKVQVTQSEYQSLLIQSAKKGISKNKVDALVVIIAAKKPSVEEQVEAWLKNN